FLKLAPDLVRADLDDIAAAIDARPIEGLVVSNTTLDRSRLSDSRQAGEAGGLSGAPLFVRSTQMLALLRRKLGPEITIVGVGGVDSVETALEKIRAGADLVQLYTGLIYEGPSLPARILAGLDRYAMQEGLSSLQQIRDS